MIKHKILKSTTLLEALKELFPKSSNNTLRIMLQKKRVVVDDKIEVKANLILESNQTIEVKDKDKKINKTLPNNLKILYSDEFLIIINKPEILLSVPTEGGNEPNILTILRIHYNTNEIYAVHRIDKETSGVMIFAKGEKSREKIDEMFKNHSFKRVYHAIVMGHVTYDIGTWKSRLVELDNFQVVPTKNVQEGKIAITNYRVLKRLEKYTYLELTLETGRKHQIRVQAKQFGHPIIGDKRYGSKIENPISRICLHAYLLEFIHPFLNEVMSFIAPIPARFNKLLKD